GSVAFAQVESLPLQFGGNHVSKQVEATARRLCYYAPWPDSPFVLVGYGQTHYTTKGSIQAYLLILNRTVVMWIRMKSKIQMYWLYSALVIAPALVFIFYFYLTV